MNHLVLADDQAIFRAGAARVLAAQEDMRIVAQCDSLQRLEEVSEKCNGCVLLLAYSLRPHLPEIAARARRSSQRIILITKREETLPAAELNLVDGILCRTADSTALINCVRRVARGERMIQRLEASEGDGVGRRVRERLSHRELQIVGYIVRGCKNREIAEELGTKEQVVKNHLRSIYDKVGVSDRLELALFTLHHRVLAEAAAQANAISPQIGVSNLILQTA